MSTHVVGFRPPDDTWMHYKAVWDACKAADVYVPEEVHEFFNWEEPDPRGVEVELQECLTEYHDANRTAGGYELAVADIPKGVTIIRFTNSW